MCQTQATNDADRSARYFLRPVFEKVGVNEVAERAFRRHYGQVYRHLRRRTGDHHRAEDLAQQVFAVITIARSLRLAP